MNRYFPKLRGIEKRQMPSSSSGIDIINYVYSKLHVSEKRSFSEKLKKINFKIEFHTSLPYNTKYRQNLFDRLVVESLKFYLESKNDKTEHFLNQIFAAIINLQYNITLPKIALLWIDYLDKAIKNSTIDVINSDRLKQSLMLIALAEAYLSCNNQHFRMSIDRTVDSIIYQFNFIYMSEDDILKQIKAFKRFQHLFDDIDSFIDVIENEYLYSTTPSDFQKKIHMKNLRQQYTEIMKNIDTQLIQIIQKQKG